MRRSDKQGKRNPALFASWEGLQTVGFSFLGFAIAISVSFALWFGFIRTEPYDPLEFSAQIIQRIEPDGEVIVPLVAGYPGPAVPLDDTVPVHAELFVEGKEPVEVVGSITWLTTNPPGLECTEVDTVPRLLDPGLSVFNFENDIPGCVLDHMADGEPRQWKITGTAQPTAPGGVQSVWSTEEFWLVP